MRTQSMDTSPEVERVLIQLHQKNPPAKRFALTRSINYMAFAGSRHPIPSHLDAQQREQWFIEHLYPNTFSTDFLRTAEASFDIQSTILRISSCAALARTKWAIMGSLAVCIYGFPRSIEAIELLIPSSALEHVGKEIADHFLAGQAQHPNMRIFLDRHTLIEVVITKKCARFDTKTLLARSRQMPIVEGEISIPILSAEDTLLIRLQHYIATGSRDDAQWNDLMGIMKIQAPVLDASYLHKRAKAHSMTAQLVQLMHDTAFGGTDVATYHHSNGYPSTASSC